MKQLSKTYTRRDSATAVLRKMGVQPRDYNLFIKSVGTVFICEVHMAKCHLETLKKPAKRASVKKATKRTVSSVIREHLLGGKTNKEIWALVKDEFGLGDKQKHYPAWYRAEAKRRGLLSAA